MSTKTVVAAGRIGPAWSEVGPDRRARVAELIGAYLHCRRTRIRVCDQSPWDRAGRFLLWSAGLSADGHPQPWGAVRLALANNESAAAVEIADVLLPELSGGGFRPVAMSGEIGGAL